VHFGVSEPTVSEFTRQFCVTVLQTFVGVSIASSHHRLRPHADSQHSFKAWLAANIVLISVGAAMCQGTQLKIMLMRFPITFESCYHPPGVVPLHEAQNNTKICRAPLHRVHVFDLGTNRHFLRLFASGNGASEHHEEPIDTCRPLCAFFCNPYCTFCPQNI
jgi:hypothetical protein